jgi:hypothetical protein
MTGEFILPAPAASTRVAILDLLADVPEEGDGRLGADPRNP